MFQRNLKDCKFTPQEPFANRHEGTNKTTISIKSMKSEFKVYKPNLILPESTKISPVLASKGNISHINDEGKITHCWNKLKLNVLSKAIVIAPDVGPCTIGHRILPCDDDCDNPDINSQVVTSTPLKAAFKSGQEINLIDFYSKSPGKEQSMNSYSSNDEMAALDTLRKLCHIKVESYIRNRVQAKRELLLKEWEALDQKGKEQLFVLQTEANNKRIMREEQQDSVLQKIVWNTEYNIKIVQQEHQRKVQHDKIITETGGKMRQIEQRRQKMEENKRQCKEDFFKLYITYNQIYNGITEKKKTCKDIRFINEKLSGEITKVNDMNMLMNKLAEKSDEGRVTAEDLKSAESHLQQIQCIHNIFSQYVDKINHSYSSDTKHKHKRDEKAVQETAHQTKISLDYEQINKEKYKDALLPEHLDDNNHLYSVDTKHALERDDTKHPLERDDIKLALQRDNKAKEEAAHPSQVNEKVDKENYKAALLPEQLVCGVKDCVSGDNLNWHRSLTLFLEEYEEQLQPLLLNYSLQKFKINCRKSVVVPVNAISPLNEKHLQDKLSKLVCVLNGSAVPLDNTMFRATEHPLGVLFCTNVLAKTFVKQGEHTVSSKPESAFAIAAVIVALWVDIPDFGQLLLAHFQCKCPYLIPAFMPQLEGQTNEHYYRSLGYNYSEDGQVESQDKFLRRMSGMMRLYAAILVTPLKRSMVADGKQHPHSMKDAWHWITSFLNLSPRADISATLLLDFMEVAGGLMFQTYRMQFAKLLQFISDKYFPMIEEVTPIGCGGPVSRLKTFLEKIIKEANVPPPKGLLPQNFW